MIDNIKKLKETLDSVLTDLSAQQKDLLKQLPDEDKAKYQRFLKRAKELTKQGDINGLIKLKNNFK